MESSILAELHSLNREAGARFPGTPPTRQPVHVLYGGAQLFKSETPRKMADLALRALHEYAPEPEDLDRLFGLDPRHGIHSRIVRKLESSDGIEDFRIDFEDGYGARSDEEEDLDAKRAGEALAQASATDRLPPFCGVRIRSLGDETASRALRTLRIFLTVLTNTTPLPGGFVITLPKITGAGHVRVFSRVLGILESELGLAHGALRFEVMIETPQVLTELPHLSEAAGGRLQAAHFGAYDYTASCDIAASEQSLAHPSCDYARQAMKIAFAGTPVWLSDGATNLMPIGPHRPAASPAELEKNRAVVHRAWKASYSDVRRSLSQGFYQGWDLHPAQIPARYAALYSFFLEALGPASQRIRAFVGRAAQASLVGNVFDDAASAQGLLNFFMRGRSCGALTDSELDSSGLTREQLETRSFSRILELAKSKSQ